MTETLRQLYSDFNARDIDAVLAVFTDHVTWPDMINQRIIHGHVAVRAYWEAQWSMVNPNVVPLAFESVGDDQVLVRVAQTIRDLSGNVLDVSEPIHEYTFDNDLVACMTIQGTTLTN